MIHDPDEAGRRMVDMVREGAILTESGKRIETRIDTICLHGDTPTAVKIAVEVRRALQDDGTTLARFQSVPV